MTQTVCLIIVPAKIGRKGFINKVVSIVYNPLFRRQKKKCDRTKELKIFYVFLITIINFYIVVDVERNECQVRNYRFENMERVAPHNGLDEVAARPPTG